MTEKQQFPVRNTKTESKKAAIVGNHRKTPSPVLIGVVAALLLLGAAALFYSSLDRPTPPVAAGSAGASATSTPTVTATAAIHPIGPFEDGKALHFALRDGAVTIRYFVLKSADGILRAAFDACDVCWPEGKGYYQSGDEMVCRNCGRRFASVLVNEVKGGCNPAPLNREVRGDRLVIQIDDILEGRSYFDFSGKA